MFQIIQYAVCHNLQRRFLVIKKLSEANHVFTSCFNMTRWIYVRLTGLAAKSQSSHDKSI